MFLISLFSLYLKPGGLFLFRTIIVPPDNYSEASFRPDGGNGQCPGAVFLTLQRALGKMQTVVSGSGLWVRVCISSKLPGVTDAARPGTTLGIVSPRKWMIFVGSFHCAHIFCFVFKTL